MKRRTGAESERNRKIDQAGQGGESTRANTSSSALPVSRLTKDEGYIREECLDESMGGQYDDREGESGVYASSDPNRGEAEGQEETEGRDRGGKRKTGKRRSR